MDELRQRILRRRDVIILDEEFSCKGSYLVCVNEYGIVPSIFPRSSYVLLVGMVVALGFNEKRVCRGLGEG